MFASILHWVSQAQQAGQSVVITSWVELLTITTLITLGIGAYRKIECHQTGCHRIGRFTHGHFHLCHAHHPQVPSDGKITAEHINRIPGTPLLTRRDDA
jgi:hypothetical protein